MQPPNIDNLFLAGGIVFYFDNGTGERDLGLIEEPPDVEPKATEIKVYSSRSGKRRLAKIFTTEEEVNWSFKLQEAVTANMQAFFKGGPIQAINPGSAQVADQKVTLNGQILASLGEYGISAVTVRQFLDYCFQEIGGAFTDPSAVVDQASGTAFDVLGAPTDVLYLGKNTRFQSLYFNLAVPGAYTGLAFKYWNGTAWTSLTVSGAGDTLSASGPLSFTPPADWQPCFVNNIQAYFLQVTATGVTTQATVTNIRQNLTQNVDYIVNPGEVGPALVPGQVGRLASGQLADGEEVKVSFTYSTWSALRFAVANDEYQQGAARIQFRPLKGFQWNYIIPRCQLKPNGKMTLDDKKVVEVPMTMQVLDATMTNPGTSYPFGYWECINEA